MRLKEYPEIMVDVIPKLYENHFKVFITHLVNIETKLALLPKQFCKMYTTESLANQLLGYLRERGAKVSQRDFCIVKESQPLQLRLSDGKRLELMLCAGNELHTSLTLLIRKWYGGRLLFYYSAVRQEDLWRLMGNLTYQKWIAEGTEQLLLNLQDCDRPFAHLSFEELAVDIAKHAASVGGTCGLRLPLFGYEYLAFRLAQTERLYGQIQLDKAHSENFKSLSSDTSHFQLPGYATTLKILATRRQDYDGKMYPLSKVDWSPAPDRMNLIQLCSLLRPVHINGIVDFHVRGNVPHVPQYLKRFQLRYSPRLANALDPVPETQLTETRSPGQRDGSTARRDAARIIKKRKLHFVDYEDDGDLDVADDADAIDDNVDRNVDADGCIIDIDSDE